MKVIGFALVLFFGTLNAWSKCPTNFPKKFKLRASNDSKNQNLHFVGKDMTNGSKVSKVINWGWWNKIIRISDSQGKAMALTDQKGRYNITFRLVKCGAEKVNNENVAGEIVFKLSGTAKAVEKRWVSRMPELGRINNLRYTVVERYKRMWVSPGDRFFGYVTVKNGHDKSGNKLRTIHYYRKTYSYSTKNKGNVYRVATITFNPSTKRSGRVYNLEFFPVKLKTKLEKLLINRDFLALKDGWLERTAVVSLVSYLHKYSK